MEANVSDLHAAASNAACEANPSNFKVGYIIILYDYYKQVVSPQQLRCLK